MSAASGMFASGGGRNRTMYSNLAVAVVLLPNEGMPRVAFAPAVPIGESPTVDWPLCLGETPAPFTSRSPGIATLGPSYVLPTGSWAIVL